MPFNPGDLPSGILTSDSILALSQMFSFFCGICTAMSFVTAIKIMLS